MSDYLTLEQACEKFSLSKSFFYKKTSAREIPFFKIGRTIFFDAVELEKNLLRRYEKVGA